MRSIVSLGFSILVACGPVTEKATDGGDACGGTIDGDGNCVCPSRQLPPTCDLCAPGWRGDDCSEFADNFDRPDGPLGEGYEAEATRGLINDAMLSGGRACGDNQAIGLVAEVIDSRNLTARLVFDPGNANGQEVNFIIVESPDLTSFDGVYIAGCDGGGGMCTLQIEELNQPPLMEAELANALTPGVDHVFELGIDGSANIQIRVTPGDGNPPTTINAELPLGYQVGRIGFIVGREADGTLSCVDDLTVSVD